MSEASPASGLEQKVEALERRLAEKELVLLEQEHRTFQVWKNLIDHWGDASPRRQAAIRSFLYWLLFDRPAAMAALSTASIFGLYLAYNANELLGAQNALIQQEMKQSEERSEKANQLLEAQNALLRQEIKQSDTREGRTRRIELIKVLQGRATPCNYDERVCRCGENDCPPEHRTCPYASTELERWEALLELAKAFQENEAVVPWRERSNGGGGYWPGNDALPLEPLCFPGVSSSLVDISGDALRLSGSNFADASLPYLNARDSHLDYADFSDAYLPGSNLSHSSVLGARFSRAMLREVDFSSTLIRGADFSKSDLRNSYFADADATDRRISKSCNLCAKRTDFQGARLQGANFLEMRFPEDADNDEVISWSGATYDEFTLFPAEFDPIAHGMIFMPVDP